MPPSLRERFGFGPKKDEPTFADDVREPELNPHDEPPTALKPATEPFLYGLTERTTLSTLPRPLSAKESANEPLKAPEPVKRLPLPIKQEETPMPRVKDEEYDEEEEDEQDEADDEQEDGAEDDDENEEAAPGRTSDKVAPPMDPPASKARADKEPLGGRYAVRKLIPRPVRGKDGKLVMKPVFKNLETYEGKPPREDDIKDCLVPLWGGGDYLVIDTSTKKKVAKYSFDGPELDPEGTNEQVSVAAPAAPAPPPTPAPASEVKPDIMTKVAAMKTAAHDKVLEVLERTLESAVAAGNMDLVDRTLDRIVALGNGGKSPATGGQDQMVQMLMTMMNSQQAQSQANLNTIVQIMSKEKNNSGGMKDSVELLSALLGLSQKMGGGGEDSQVAVVREVGGVVKDSMKEVTDTLVSISGSGPVKDKDAPTERYSCERCGGEVQPTWKLCPNCGLVFKPGVKPPAGPAIRSVPVEVFENRAPPIPQPVKEKMAYLKNLANFIRHKHDPEQKGQMVFKMCNPEDKLALLFTAEFGYKNLMKMAYPFRNSKEIPDLDLIFKIVESPDGESWINRMFASIKAQAAVEGVYLNEPDKEDFINKLNEHSVVKFSYRPKAKAAPPLKPVPTGNEQVSVERKEAPPIKCAICEDMVPANEYQKHLFTKHPRPAKPREAPEEEVLEEVG